MIFSEEQDIKINCVFGYIMSKDLIIEQLQKLSGHSLVELTTRGNTAISAALSVVVSSGGFGKKVLIPEEGGWLTYKTIPKKLGLEIVEVRCCDAVLDLGELHRLLETKEFGALLYQNPAGYFAKQPMREIYELCSLHNCIVVLDVSGGIGTELCSGEFADIIVGSFGTWKLVEAKGGGFVSTSNKKLFEVMCEKGIERLEDAGQMDVIYTELGKLAGRIEMLLGFRQKVVDDLIDLKLDVVHADAVIGFVVVVRFNSEYEKDKIVDYCNASGWEYTECPRYIRLNQPAISIELKRKE